MIPAENPTPRDSKSIDPAGVVGRSLARLRKVGLSVQTEPLREMRVEMGLDMQVVYFALRMPFAGGATLRIPLIAAITPKFYSPTRAQHL